MKKYIITFVLAAVVAVGIAFAQPVSAVVTPTVGCTYTASPSSFPNGVLTTVTLHYTSTNATWFIGTLFGGGITAYGTSGNQVVKISKATSYEMVAIDYASGNAHYCRAQVSTTSHIAP